MRKLNIIIVSLMLFVWGTAKAELVVSNWDGYSPADIMETFEATTGFKGEMSFHATKMLCSFLKE